MSDDHDAEPRDVADESSHDAPATHASGSDTPPPEEAGDGGTAETSLVDMLVFGPIDALFELLRDPRGAAARGRARVELAVRQARTLGELTVRFGASELRRRTGGEDEPSQPSQPSLRSSPDAGPPPDGVIANYDELSASQIVPMLAGLTAAERTEVADYETRARGRQTILRKIAQLDRPGE